MFSSKTTKKVDVDGQPIELIIKRASASVGMRAITLLTMSYETLRAAGKDMEGSRFDAVQQHLDHSETAGDELAIIAADHIVDVVGADFDGRPWADLSIAEKKAFARAYEDALVGPVIGVLTERLAEGDSGN